MDELTALVRDLGAGLKSRVEAVEANQAVVEERQEQHRAEVENRLNRYEETNTRMADRVVTSVERLARLEVIPERMEKLERLVAAQGQWMRREMTATNRRIDLVERQLKEDEAKQTGRMQAGRVFLESVKFLADYGWKLGVAIGGGALALQAFELGGGGQVTIQQPAEGQGSALPYDGQAAQLRLD